jgi:dinuclear metal center YbgI/SA1388 family protein
VYRPLASVRTDTSTGRILETLIRAGISAWVPHTALDVAPGGTNDELARLLSVEGARPLQTTVTRPDGSRLGIGRVGRLATPLSLAALASTARERLAAPWAHLVAKDPSALATTVAVLAGDGRRYVEAAAAAGADVLVTGDVDHHTALAALARGIALIDVGHWGSEHHAARLLATGLRARLAGEPVEVLESAVDTQPFRLV